MIAKNILYNKEAKEKLLAGVNKLNDIVKVTLGPGGNNVLYTDNFKRPVITKDGVSVAEQIVLKDETENLAAQTLKMAAIQSNKKVGDGTTSATVMAASMFNEGLSFLDKHNGNDLKRAIDKAVDHVLQRLEEIAKPVDTPELIAKVATLSGNGDSELGDLISEAVCQVGEHGVVTISESATGETYIHTVEGMQYPKGNEYPQLINEVDRGVVEYEKARVLIYNDILTASPIIDKIVNEVHNKNIPIVFIAEGFSDQFVSAAIQNRRTSNLQIVLGKAPGIAADREENLEDMAALLNTVVYGKDGGIDIDSIENIADLGYCDRVTLDRDNSTFLKEDASPLLADRVAQLHAQKGHVSNPRDAELIQERISRLDGGVSVIKVGASSDVELRELKDRYDDALHAVRASIETGVVAGGGWPLYRIANGEYFHDFDRNGKNVESAGKVIVENAILSIHSQILENLGIHVDDEDMVKLTDNVDYVYDVRNGKVANALECGVIDPLKVVAMSLKNAASVAGTLLTTEGVITDYVD